MSGYFIVTLNIKADLDIGQSGFFADAFEEEALSSSSKRDKDGWHFLWTFPFEPDETAFQVAITALANEVGISAHSIAGIHIEPLDETRDWLAESYQALPPFCVGSFFIYGSHYAGAPQDGKIPLLIEAATAFGSGEHGTTSCCILAIEHVRTLNPPLKNILDMGCGSGILAATAAKLWPELPVYAADNDPECVRVSKQHIQTNHISNIICFESEGYAQSAPVWAHAPYDFVIANILAGPLIEMASEQSKAVAQNGYLILSGTLRTQADDVFAAYHPHGFEKVAEFPGDEWMTLLLQKTAV